MTPLEEADTVPLPTVLAALGILPRAHRTYGPCPACGATKRGKEDHRGPLGLRGDRGWRCHACSAGGGGPQAVRAVVGDWPSVVDWYRERSLISGSPRSAVRVALPPAPPPPPERPRVPPEELRQLMCASLPVPGDIPDRRLVSPLCRWLPDGRMPRWAHPWRASGHRVLIPMWDAAGRIACVRARAADRAAAHPKSRSPTGYAIGPACMASPTTLRWLRGGPAPEGVVVVEGEPAWVAWAEAHPAHAVLGIVGGSFAGEWGERIGDLPTLVVTDHDTQGDKYAATWLGGVRRGVRWPHSKDETGERQ